MARDDVFDGKSIAQRRAMVFALLKMRYGSEANRYEADLRVSHLPALTLLLERTLLFRTVEPLFEPDSRRTMSRFEGDLGAAADLDQRYLEALRDALEHRAVLAGMRKLLMGVLAERFGPLPPQFAEHISTATDNEIETWARRALTDSTLMAVFSSPTRSR